VKFVVSFNWSFEDWKKYVQGEFGEKSGNGALMKAKLAEYPTLEDAYKAFATFDLSSVLSTTYGDYTIAEVLED